jgi:hypothetical protein
MGGQSQSANDQKTAIAPFASAWTFFCETYALYDVKHKGRN